MNNILLFKTVYCDDNSQNCISLCKANKRSIYQSIYCCCLPDRLECKVVVKVVLPHHHGDGLEERGEGVVKDGVLAEGEVEGEGKGQKDRHEHQEAGYELSGKKINI